MFLIAFICQKGGGTRARFIMLLVITQAVSFLVALRDVTLNHRKCGRWHGPTEVTHLETSNIQDVHTVYR